MMKNIGMSLCLLLLLGCIIKETDLMKIVLYSENRSDVLFTDNNTILLCYSSENRSKHYSVPEGVVKIAEGAFAYNQYLEKISMPNSLLYISNRAFYESEIQEVDIQEGLLEIGNEAFYQSKLRKIVFPRSLIKIGDAAFEGCNLVGLETLVLPERLLYLGTYAFFANPIPEQTMIELPSSLTTIGVDIFRFGESFENDWAPVYLVHQNSYALEWAKEYDEDYIIIECWNNHRMLK